jgi:nucleotidyltransferase/DNA polymerase involved in DNA repair
MSSLWLKLIALSIGFFFIYPVIYEKTTEALMPMGITKVEELANCDIYKLSERFGKMGLWMKQVANGFDFIEVKKWEEAVKSKAGVEHLRKIQTIL